MPSTTLICQTTNEMAFVASMEQSLRQRIYEHFIFCLKKRKDIYVRLMMNGNFGRCLNYDGKHI